MTYCKFCLLFWIPGDSLSSTRRTWKQRICDTAQFDCHLQPNRHRISAPCCNFQQDICCWHSGYHVLWTWIQSSSCWLQQKQMTKQNISQLRMKKLTWVQFYWIWLNFIFCQKNDLTSVCWFKHSLHSFFFYRLNGIDWWYRKMEAYKFVLVNTNDSCHQNEHVCRHSKIYLNVLICGKLG